RSLSPGSRQCARPTAVRARARGRRARSCRRARRARKAAGRPYDRSCQRFIHQANVCYSSPGSTKRASSGAHWQYSRYGTHQQEKPMTLPERLAAFRANFEAGGPPYHAPAWVHELMHRATDELTASGAAERALKAGDRAPEFTLKDADGHEVSSRDLLAKGPLVVTF